MYLTKHNFFKYENYDFKTIYGAHVRHMACIHYVNMNAILLVIFLDEMHTILKHVLKLSKSDRRFTAKSNIKYSSLIFTKNWLILSNLNSTLTVPFTDFHWTLWYNFLLTSTIHELFYVEQRLFADQFQWHMLASFFLFLSQQWPIIR